MTISKTELKRRPSVRLLCSHPAHFLSLGLGSGLAPKAPGTFGSFAAWAVFAALSCIPYPLPVWVAWLLLGLALLLGIVSIPLTGRELGEVDHGSIVWDEFVAVWLVLLCLPATWRWQLAGVLVFRFFDILKPWPVRVADARLKNGFGVMFDDLLAAGYTLVCLWIACRLWS